MNRLGQRPAKDLIASARDHERAGCVREALSLYEAAIAEAERLGEHLLLAEALRRVAVVHHQRGEYELARSHCERSLATANAVPDAALAGEALNTLGCMLIREGQLADATTAFLRALEVGGEDRGLHARVERNLGVVANIQGDLAEAQHRYARSLDDALAVGDDAGAAAAYHNLGMVCADRELHAEADEYFLKTLGFADRVGDVRLRGHCLVNHADVHLARQRFEEARRDAEAALAIFDQLGARDHKASAYRVIGVVYRETGRLALAESRLRAAIDLAADSRVLLVEAESTRELAVLYQQMGRNHEALLALNGAHALFARLDARMELVNVGGRLEELESTYLAVVREWGQSLESSDSYTYGHCSRVADNAVAVAEALGFDALEVTTVRLGAYLHDLGKVNVPHEILNKPGPLTRDEFEVVQMHPVWGIELLDGIEFPWDLKPIIRWHHEKADGTGYPDQLRGDEIPLAAQVVGIVDVYDALTTTRAYRPAMSHDDALTQISAMRAAWSDVVYDAFTRVMAAPGARSLAA